MKTQEDLLFKAGDFQNLISIFEKSPKAIRNKNLIVGSYVFTNELAKAEALVRKEKLKKNAPSLFFLSLGYTRTSRYEEARQMLKKLLQLGQASKSDRFYIYQGMAFYRYFCGRYRKALLWVNRAQDKVLDNSHEQMIHCDLKSHILVRLGQIQNGIQLGKQALKLAKSFRNATARESIEVALAVYESQFQSQTERTLKQLLQLKSDFSSKNSYYFINLTLEYVRRLNLEGKLEQAGVELESIQKELFAGPLNRQKAVWSFRQAHIFYLQRKHELALDQCESALDYLDLNVDLYLAVQILGLKYKILKLQNGSQSQIQKLESQIKKMTWLCQDAMALSYAYRYGWIHKPVTEDPFASFFHQWIRVGHKSYSLIQKVLERKWTTLFVDLIPQGSESFIYLDVVPKNLLLFGQNQIAITEGLTPLIRQSLLLLCRREVTKHEFVELIWGYQYDSYRHDPLIYTLVNRIRELLGFLSPQLVLGNKVRLINTEVRVYEHLQAPSRPTDVKLVSEALAQKYNRRQLEILEHLSENKYLTVTKASEILQTTKVTACRDLTQLVKDKKIEKIGKGRATSYQLV